MPAPDPIRRGLLVLPFLLSPLLSREASAALSKISSARVWPANEYTRVTFESPSALKYQHFFVKNPERLVIDIENIEIGPSLKELAAKSGFELINVGPDQMERFMREKTEVYTRVGRQMGLVAK